LEFLAEYGMFLLRVATIVIAIIIVTGAITSGNRHKKGDKKGTIKVTHLNDHIDGLHATLQASVLDKEQLKQVHKLEKKETKAEKKALHKKEKESTSE
jgi:serine protease SohB